MQETIEPKEEQKPMEIQTKVVVSPAQTMTDVDWQKWLKNALIFVSFPAILYLNHVQASIELDGFQWDDFMMTPFILGSTLTYFIATITDLLRKYIPEKSIIIPQRGSDL